MKKKYTFNYSIDGILSFAPQFHEVEAHTFDEAVDKALTELGPKATIHIHAIAGL